MAAARALPRQLDLRETEHARLVLSLYYFVAFGAVGLYLPFFATWLQGRGFFGWQMSAIMALLPACQLLSPTLIGMLSDRLGLRGKMMTFCAVVTATGLSVFGLSALLLQPLPFPWALCCMFAFTALRSPTIGLADVLALEISTNYGRVRLWGSLGFMVSALVGGALMNPTHAFALPVTLAAYLWVLVIVSWFLPQVSRLPPRPARHDLVLLLQQHAYRGLLVTIGLIFASFTAYDMCATLRLRELAASGTQIGLFWAIGTLSEVVLLFFSGDWLKQVGAGKLLAAACSVSVLRWLALATLTDVSWVLALQPLHAISFGLMWVSAMGVLKRETGQRGGATAQGLFASSVALGGTVGMSVWGSMYEAWGSWYVFVISAGVMALAVVSASRLIRLTSPDARV